MPDYYWQVLRALPEFMGDWEFWSPLLLAVGLWVLRYTPKLRDRMKSSPAVKWVGGGLTAVAFSYGLLSANYAQYREKATQVAALADTLHRREAADSAAKPDLNILAKGGYLEVQNNGGAGHVQVRMRVANAFTFPSTPPISEDARYDVLWESSGNGESDMLSGQVDRIILSGKPEEDRIAFHYFRGLTQRADSFVAKGAPLLSVEVTFLADPPLASGAIVKNYMIGTNGVTDQP